MSDKRDADAESTAPSAGLDPERPILRFMSFSKFMDMMTFGRAFFPSVRTLRYGDPLEGVPPAMNAIVEGGLAGAFDHLVNYAMPRSLGVGKASEELRAEPPRPRPVASVATPFGTIKLEDGRTLGSVLDQAAAWIDVQCWHARDVESVAMWRIYGGSEPSIAVRSTIGRLTNALRAAEGETIHLAEVEYIDHDTSVCDAEHVLAPFLRKSRPYDYEREIRALVYRADNEIDAEREAAGRYVEADLTLLIDSVFVSPAAPEWFLELVIAITEARIAAPVARSSVGRMPFYRG